jgi:hypothetical protein
MSAIAFYDNFIVGIAALVIEPSSYYNIIKVSLGVGLIVLSIVGLVSTWTKSYTTILVNGFLLLVALLTFAFVSTVDLARNFDRLDTIEKYKNIANIATKSTILTIAMFLSFSISSKSSYSMLPVTGGTEYVKKESTSSI